MKFFKTIKSLLRSHPDQEKVAEIEKLLEISDIHVNGSANFKLSYRGSIVPFWLEIPPGVDQEDVEMKIRASLGEIAKGLAAGKNLVEISQALKTVKWESPIDKSAGA